VAVAEENAVEEALAGGPSRERERLVRFLHSAAAPPDRWGTTANQELRDSPQHVDPGLFEHQLKSVAWMHQAEREECVQAKTLAFAHQNFGENYEVKLPAGGVLAHPPGAGKTRIVAAFIRSSPAPTTILCPPHLIEFWRSELATQDATAVVVPFGADLDEPGRFVIDEPQDLGFEERIQARSAATKASSVWVVCGTPRAYVQLLGEFLLGRARCHWTTTVSEYRGEPEWPYIFRRRFLADPPAMCLPRPSLEIVEVGVAVGVEGIDAAVAGLSGYLMDQMLYLTFGHAATSTILERARTLEEMGFAANTCHEITLADWDAAVVQRSERRATAAASRLAALEVELTQQQHDFANRCDMDVLRDVPAVLHIGDEFVESAPAEWNVAWAGQTFSAEVGSGILVSREVDCAAYCRQNADAMLIVFVGEDAAPMGYSPHDGPPPIPAVRISESDAVKLTTGVHVRLEVRHVSIVDEEAGNVTQEIARDGVEVLLMHEVQQLRTEMASLERAKRFADQVRTSLGAQSSTSCPICFEDNTTVAILPDCAHAFCRACFEQTVGLSGNPTGVFGCPVCRCETQRRDVVIFRHGGARDDLPQKLVKLVELLKELRDEKVLVFVQWSANLHYLKEMLAEQGISALALEGDLTTTMDALRCFSRPVDEDSSSNVLLLSFQRHASGINLQFCRHVVILHPYCPETASDLAFVSMQKFRAYETQAIGRVRRYPQTGTVRVYRFFAACSVEEEIYSIARTR
jgi:hypothetical protein